MNERDFQSDAVLSHADQRAVDALLDSGLDVNAVPEDLRDRAKRVLAILHAAGGTGDAASHGLAERVLERVRLTGTTTPAFLAAPKLALTEEHDEPALCPDDEEALDAYVMSGYRAEKVSSSLRDRAMQMEFLGQLIATTPTQPASASLVDRTLAAVAATPVRRSAPTNLVTRSSGFRLADLVSIAAALVLAGSLLWPVLTTMRGRSSRVACGSNMATIAGAFGSYANDNRDALPMAVASLGGPTWWEVGTSPERSNAANLFTLPRQNYVSLKDMACVGNPNADRDCGSCCNRTDWDCIKSVSYSYQVMFGKDRPSWGQRRAAGSAPMVILADKSPVVARASMGEPINPMENSANHGGDGQWAVRTDGSGVWLSSPQIGDDNIWLPGIFDVAIAKVREQVRQGNYSGQVRLHGNEVPSASDETFVGP